LQSGNLINAPISAGCTRTTQCEEGPKKGQNIMVKWTTITFKQLAAQKTMRMDAGYWIKQKEKNEKNNNRATSVKRPASKLHRGPKHKHAALAKVRKV